MPRPCLPTPPPTCRPGLTGGDKPASTLGMVRVLLHIHGEWSLDHVTATCQLQLQLIVVHGQGVQPGGAAQSQLRQVSGTWSGLGFPSPPCTTSGSVGVGLPFLPPGSSGSQDPTCPT